MKVVYLDQNHWIELSRAAHGRASRTVPPSVLESLRQARGSGRACFPISYAHYIETRKQREAERRSRLATFMLELSDGRTVAPSPVVLRHEIEMALGRCFPDRVVPEPFEVLGHGMAHAMGKRSLDHPLDWPPGADAMSASLRAAVERYLERSLLSGVGLMGRELVPLTDLSVERWFKASLETWRGAASQYSAGELEREIGETNFSDIDDLVREALACHGISIDEFARRGELRGRAFLDHMPSQRADMHLKMQWAKNAYLPPRESDLVDWSFLGVAVSYCDIVVTENQMADLFSRGFETHATVIAQLCQLEKLLA